jgi:hypothetical protein
MDIVVVATFEDFDETLDKRQRGPGSEQKEATQALVCYLLQQPKEAVRKVDLLILDWKSPPKSGAKEVKCQLHGGRGEKTGIWGSRDQLSAKFPASVWDVLISSGTRRFVLDFSALLKVKRRLALSSDYNLPFGPWGQEQTQEQLKDTSGVLEKYEMLCASKHLAEFVEKWGEGRFNSHCCYAADYDCFDPVPSPLSPWEEKHTYVTFVSPCPEKGLSVFMKLASAMPETQFLAVKTVAWTKPWHEQLLKKFSNVTTQAATSKVDDFLKLTKVLIAPSVGQESFPHVVTEAQLRGIPVVCTDNCGLVEANRIPVTCVSDMPLVYDQRTHELVSGMTMREAENTLAADRPGCLTMEQWRQTAVTQESYQKVADDNEVQQFMTAVQKLLGESSALQQASQDCRLAATSFVDSRRGQLLKTLQKFMQEHVAAGNAKPMAAISGPASKQFVPKARMKSEADDEDDSFDCTRDFTQVEDFDGMTMAARCLVRLCEAGNLTVAAELISAKADVNQPEPDIGITPLIGAANAGNLDICKYLIRKEADVNSVVTDGTGRTAVHAACQMGFASIVQLLLDKRADPRVEDLTKTTPMHLAAKYGHAGACELLLKNGANPNQADEQGHVPINDAVAKDRFDIVTKLLEHGALVNVRNMAGLEAISFSRTPQMQHIIMKHDINF